uniref:REJ domain-containing protein n=1 Tax=Eptatretus burgeri TaxID=7764 RepID=A0A8C4QT22_EPTBU
MDINNVMFEWFLNERGRNSQMNRTVSTSQTLRLLGGYLQAGQVYDVTAKVSVKNFVPVTAKYQFISNIPPYNGTCHAHPQNGTALETLFVITCTGWLDEGASIKRETQASENSTFVYTIVATSEGKEYTLSSSTSPETPSLFLPPGDHLNDYMLLVTSNICDEYDECAQHNMQLQVKRLTVETIKQTLENLTQPTSYLYMLANRGETKQVIQKLLLFLPYLNDLDDSKEKLVFSLISAAKSLNELKGLKKSIILKFVTGAEQDGGASDVSHIHTAACLSAPLPSSPGEKEKELSFEV